MDSNPPGEAREPEGQIIAPGEFFSTVRAPSPKACIKFASREFALQSSGIFCYLKIAQLRFCQKPNRPS